MLRLFLCGWTSTNWNINIEFRKLSEVPFLSLSLGTTFEVTKEFDFDVYSFSCCMLGTVTNRGIEVDFVRISVIT